MRIGLWIGVLCLLPALVFAQTYPKPLSDTVSDYADILPPDIEARLANRLKEIRTKTGVHLVLAVISTRANYGAENVGLEHFATGLFNDWGIGDGARNDGVLILVLPQAREMRIELGEGLPRGFDAVAASVIETVFLPEFRKGRYVQGIEAGTEATIARIVRPFSLNQKPTATVPQKVVTDNPDAVLGIGSLMLLVAGVLFGLIFKFIGDAIVGFWRCKQCGRRSLERSRVTIVQATDAWEGREEITTRCTNCGQTEVVTAAIPKTGRDRSSGGSSGFGGGRSSGGGASGRW